ncbi:MAG: hypothetical protein HYS18_14530 [Burkholderiales bacterium]|nr:hypothetical protein [Burkholderiales bacterium]
MSAPPLEKLAYVTECFMNAANVPDNLERATLEEWLVRWWQLERPGNHYAIYHQKKVYCYADGKLAQSFSLDAANGSRTLRCDGRKISVVNGQTFEQVAEVDVGGDGDGAALSNNNNNNG